MRRRIVILKTGSTFEDVAEERGDYEHWIAEGMGGLEGLLAGTSATGEFCHGDTPTMADCCLVPQIYNAERFGCDMSGYPTAMRINAACLALDAFQQALPEVQPDAEA